MNPFYKFFLCLLPLSAFLSSCDTALTGERIENQPPKTFLLTDRIVRSGDDRLSSQIDISWWANDPDGFVVSYEWTIGDTAVNPWKPTSRTDSTFLLPMGANSDSADITFRVRAIDNEGKKDVSGASLVFPLKNSAPEILFNKITSAGYLRDIPPDTSYQFFTFGWRLSDIDGTANIEKIQFSINSINGPWHDLDKSITFIAFAAPRGQTAAALYTGLNLRAEGRTFTSFNQNAKNSFYIRARDLTGAVSKVDSVSWYIKQQRSRILVVNDLVGPQRYTRFKVHTDSLRALGLTDLDLIDVTDGAAPAGAKVTRSTAFPARIAPAASRMLADWDFLYWVSDDLDRNISYGTDLLAGFFGNGGKLFVTIPVKRKIVDDDPVLNYLSIQTIVTSPTGSFRIPAINTTTSSAGIVPVPPQTGPVLSSSSPISEILPFRPVSGSIPIYRADFKIQRSGFPPPPLIDYPRQADIDLLPAPIWSETVAVKNPDGNIIFFGMDLLQLNRDANIGRLLQRLCIQDMGFRHN